MIYKPLSKREKQIVKMVCEKEIITDKQIMKRLKISYSTVRAHFLHIYDKTLLTSKKDMIFKYYNGGKEKWEIN